MIGDSHEAQRSVARFENGRTSDRVRISPGRVFITDGKEQERLDFTLVSLERWPRLDGRKIPAVAMSTERLDRNSSIRIVGYPGGYNEKCQSLGTVRQTQYKNRHGQTLTHLRMYDSNTLPGSSGGPIFKGSKFVGIHRGTSPVWGNNFGSHMEAILRNIDRRVRQSARPAATSSLNISGTVANRAAAAPRPVSAPAYRPKVHFLFPYQQHRSRAIDHFSMYQNIVFTCGLSFSKTQIMI